MVYETIVRAMKTELNALETKVEQVVTLCHALRAENQQLRQELITAQNEKKLLCERMEAARVRIEQLADQLPEAQTPA